MDIVIDFDGTVVTHSYPKIGNNIGSVPVLKELISNGHNLILFTMRSDPKEKRLKQTLTEAVNWFRLNDIELYGIQTNPSQHFWTSSKKAYGELIIDDAALGCPLKYDTTLSLRPFVDWVEVRKYLVLNNLIKQ